jgi:rhodanese-related sulfurtransferase
LIEPITPAELKSWLEDESRESPVLIDVREPWEHSLARVEGSVHMPMQTIPSRVAELDSSVPHVLMCHHGMRSYQVAQFLARQGFDRLHNLSGGIDAWASEVDPEIPRY